jgi:hypothetical protein
MENLKGRDRLGRRTSQYNIKMNLTEISVRKLTGFNWLSIQTSGGLK